MNATVSKFTIPKLSPADIEDIQNYWRVYEVHLKEIAAKMRTNLSQHTEIQLVMQRMSPSDPTEQTATLDAQRRAVYQNEWEPFVRQLEAQGMKYADSGMSFQTWFDIVSVYRSLSLPYLIEAYLDSPPLLLSALNGMDRLLDISIHVIGNAYIETKERSLAEQGKILLESEQKFSIVFEKAPFSAALSKLPEGTLVNINKGFEQMFGFSPEEALGKTSLDLGINPNAEQRAHIVAQIQKQGFARNVETILRTKSGEERNFLLNIDMVDIGGEKYALQTAQDITDRKRAEENLAYQASLLENVNDAIVGSDAQYRLNFWNAVAESMYGWKAEEVLGKNGVDIMQTRWANADSTEMRQRIRETGQWRGEAIQVRRDGTPIPVEISSVALHDAKGQVTGFISIIRDISERKQAEEELRKLNEQLEGRVRERTLRLEEANLQLQKRIEERQRAENKFRGLLDSAPDAIVVVNEKGIIQIINNQTTKMFGYTSEELIGQSVEVLVPKRFQRKHVKHRGEYFIHHPARPMGIGLELFGVRKDGSEFPVEISLGPLESDEGLLISAAIRDVTQRKQNEEMIKNLNAELRQHAAQLETANKELESFSYSVSHDLRAPLRSIDGFSQAVLEDYGDQLPQQGRDYLERVRVAAQRMAVLIDDLLNLSRVTRTPLEPKLVNLSVIAAEITGSLQEADPDRKVEVSIMPDLNVEGDPHLLRIVMDNLIRNAWKFTSKNDHAKIEFGQQKRQNNKPRTFYVRDNGVGFDMAYVDKLFGVFQRLHSISQFPGTGVGLATVQRIVNLHGGRIWAESAEGHGATFYFTL